MGALRLTLGFIPMSFLILQHADGGLVDLLASILVWQPLINLHVHSVGSLSFWRSQTNSSLNIFLLKREMDAERASLSFGHVIHHVLKPSYRVDFINAQSTVSVSQTLGHPGPRQRVTTKRGPWCPQSPALTDG